jgi:hypothetical protein
LGETHRVRPLGTVIVLLACAALQIPWFTCHSDCREDCRPIWDLAAHDCHEAEAHAPTRVHDHGHDCTCRHHAAPATPVDDEDHEPGDHALVKALSPAPPSAPNYDIAANALLFVTPAACPDEAAPARCRRAAPAPPHVAAGPPPGLASVRLLL